MSSEIEKVSQTPVILIWIMEQPSAIRWPWFSIPISRKTAARRSFFMG